MKNDKSKTKKSALGVETERRVSVLREKSIWLDGGKELKAGVVFAERPPIDLKGLEYALWEKESDGSRTGTPGELFYAQSALRDAWEAWKRRCGRDPLKRLDPKQPQDSNIQEIAEAQAKIIVIEAEVKEIQSRIEAEKLKIKKQDIEKNRWRGSYRTAKKNPKDPHCHEIVIIECDSRDVIQDKNNMPVFADDGTDVAAYLETCKDRQRQKYARKRENNLRQQLETVSEQKEELEQQLRNLKKREEVRSAA